MLEKVLIAANVTNVTSSDFKCRPGNFGHRVKVVKAADVTCVTSTDFECHPGNFGHRVSKKGGNEPRLKSCMGEHPKERP